jgi:hypothetical protein
MNATIMEAVKDFGLGAVLLAIAIIKGPDYLRVYLKHQRETKKVDALLEMKRRNYERQIDSKIKKRVQRNRKE